MKKVATNFNRNRTRARQNVSHPFYFSTLLSWDWVRIPEDPNYFWLRIFFHLLLINFSNAVFLERRVLKKKYLADVDKLKCYLELVFPAFLLPQFHRKCDLCVLTFSVQLDRSPFYKNTLSFHGSRPRHKYHSIAVSGSHSCAGLQLVRFSSCGAVTFLFDEVLKPTFFYITYLNAFEAKRRDGPT